MTYPTQQISSFNPQNIAVSAPIYLQKAIRDPTAQDDTFPPGTEWLNSTSGMFFKCVSATITGAAWEPFVPNAAGTVSTVTGNSGAAVGPDGDGNINIVGDGTTILLSGNPGTNTVTASLVGGDVAVQEFLVNVTSPVFPTTAGVIDLTRSVTTYTNGTIFNTVIIELQGLLNHIFVGAGALTPATSITPGNDGILISSNSGVPSWLANSGTAGFALVANSGAPPSWSAVSAAAVAGVTSGSSPSAGFIGEQIRSVATAVALTSTIGQNATTISVTAGVWDITGMGEFYGAGSATQTESVMAVSTSVTGFNNTSNGDNVLLMQGAYATACMCVGSWRLVVSTTTTVYLGVISTFGAGVVQFFGRLSATRVG